MPPKTHKHITLNKDTYSRITRLMGAVIKDDDTGEVIKRCHYGSESVFYEELIELGLEIKQKQWNDEKKRLGLCD